MTIQAALQKVMDKLVEPAKVQAILKLVNLERFTAGRPPTTLHNVRTMLGGMVRNDKTVTRPSPGLHIRTDIPWTKAWETSHKSRAQTEAYEFARNSAGFIRPDLQEADQGGMTAGYAEAFIRQMKRDYVIYDTGERLPGPTKPFVIYAGIDVVPEDTLMVGMDSIMTLLTDDDVHDIAAMFYSDDDFDLSPYEDRLPARILEAIPQLSGGKFLEMCQAWANAQTADPKDRSD